ncbi:MAG TPA: zinc-finger domain-containing protein [Gammaproteobacteria bacterium]|nr:zinc-finger domain-containing protein [Gammaproteobacteria bacterium]
MICLEVIYCHNCFFNQHYRKKYENY